MIDNFHLVEFRVVYDCDEGSWAVVSSEAYPWFKMGGFKSLKEANKFKKKMEVRYEHM